MRLATCVLALGSCLQLACGEVSTTGSLAPSAPEFVWSAPTNHWPKKLWIYRVIPQQFSPGVVSNLMALGGFTMHDRTNMLGQPSFKDKNILYFRNQDQSRYLGIYPALGWIEYHNGKAESPNQYHPVTGVPDQEKTTSLGVQYLRLLGIDRSEIATKPGTEDLDLHWEKGTMSYVDEATDKEIVKTNNFGVYFLRRINGVRVRSIGLGGGVLVQFGNNAALMDLKVSWRNLKKDRLVDIMSPEEILRRLRTRQIAVPSVLGQFGKLTVTAATPEYEGKYGDEPMDFVRPLLRLDVITDRGPGAKGAWFECPIENSR